MECVNCGASLAPNTDMCVRCGSVVHQAPQVAVVQPAPQEAVASPPALEAMKRAVEICVVEKYAEFDGRASRSELWWFFLVLFLADLVISNTELFITGTDVLSWLLTFGLLVPTLAVGARRLHDINHSGWWNLLWLVPIIGWIILIVLFALPSQEGRNEYGDPNPLTVQVNHGGNHE